MHNCLHTHRRCSPITSNSQQHNTTNLPTRVLDVGASDSAMIRLLISNGGKGEYAALSHRWGNPEKMECTTTATLESRINGIAIDSLSPLFRDAVTVTRRLGLTYLWIDSLCILQGSPEDWEQESATMGDVYARAKIVISAIASEDGFSGFLGQRDINSVRISYRKSITDLGNGFIYFRGPKTNFNTLRECVLNKRAWVLQERTLGPRVLSFAKDQIIWECRELQASEGGRQCEPEKESRAIVSALQNLSIDRLNPSLRAEVFRAWREIVSLITQLDITYETDRLYTILNIAKHVQRETRSEYLHGTWIDDLALGLFWSPQARNKSLFTCRPTIPPRAPSWSWASLEGPIIFWQNDLDHTIVCFERVVLDNTLSQRPSNPEPPSTLHLLALVRPCEVTKDGITFDQDGNQLPVPPDCEGWVFATKAGGFATLTEAGIVIGGSHFDLQPSEDTLGMYSCLPLLDVQRPLAEFGGRYGIGLLLKPKFNPTDAQETYTRVGYVSLSHVGIAWLNEVERRCIALQ